MAEKKGPAKKKKSGTPLMGRLYEQQGSGLKTKNPTCPKCGPGVFMALHADRNLCGKCGYMEKTK